MRVNAGIKEVDLSNNDTSEMIRDAEYWAISKLKQAKLWDMILANIRSGTVYEDLFNATVYYAAAECIQRVFSSAGERSQTNFPESFQMRSLGGISVGQPDWKRNYDIKMKLAMDSMSSFIQLMQDEQQVVAENIVAQKSNRDFDAVYDRNMGMDGLDFDWY